MMASRNAGPYAWMLAGCFFLAWMGQFAHLLSDTCDWRVIALARASVALVVAVCVALGTGARLVLWRPGALWLRGCASSVSLLCTFFAFTTLPTGEVLALTNTFPIWVVFLSWPLQHARPTSAAWLAAAVGVMGVALIQSPHFQADSNAPAAAAIALVAALANAIAMLGLHRLKGVASWAIVAHYSGVAVVFVLAACLIGPWPDLAPVCGTGPLVLLLAMGISATLGQFCVTRAFTCGQPARIAVVALSLVVFALILDTFIAGSTVVPITFAGIALVLAAAAWTLLDERRATRRAAVRAPRGRDGHRAGVRSATVTASAD